MAGSFQSRRYGSSSTADPVEELIKSLPIPLALILAEELKDELREALGKAGRLVTRTVVMRDVVLEGVSDLLKVSGKGRVREAVIVSDTTSYDVYVEVDGRSVLNHSFDDLALLSDVLEFVDALSRNGSYLLRLSELSFLSGCVVRVKPRGSVRLSQVLITYDVLE